MTETDRRGKNKRASASYCIIRNDYRIRDIIKYYMEARNETYRTLAAKLDLNENNIREFITKGTKVMSQFNVIRLCNVLGIELSIDIKTTRVDRE